MSRKLSFEIGGVRDDDSVSVTVGGKDVAVRERYGTGIDPAERGGMHGPDDPAERGGMHGPDDPAERGGMHEPDDPAERGGMHEPDDPAERGGMHEPDDPGAYGCGEMPGDGPPGSVRTAPLDAGVPAPAERYSGFIILRLSSLVPLAGVARPDPGGDNGQEHQPPERAAFKSTDDLLGLAKTLGLDALERVLERFGRPPSSRAITIPTAARQPKKRDVDNCAPPGIVSLEDLERRAAGSDFPPRHSLRSYWRLDARGLEAKTRRKKEVRRRNGLGYSQAALARRLIAELNALSEVALAYRELSASDPAENPLSHITGPSPEDLSDFQSYLQRQPVGLDARWARDRLNDADGSIALADLEQGWITGHEEIAGELEPFVGTSDAHLAHGDNRHGEQTYRGHHGTAVVSELVGNAENRLGVVGVAAGVAKVTLASHYKAEDPTRSVSEAAQVWPSNGHVADAITALMTGETPALQAGDVLLLEVQRAGRPTEVDPLDFDAIRLASANGVIVVEAAGNGGLDLDHLPTEDGRSLNRRSRRFLDSGAILVGAAGAEPPHNRAWFSNHGSRIDCFAWGERVVAAGYGDYLDGNDEQVYTDGFSGTSSASPMIAGAAVLVQNLYRQNAGPAVSSGNGDDESWKRLSPIQMRSLLAARSTGTRQGRARRGSIGVMPNLRAVVERALGIVPQVYLRDHVGDTGQETAIARTYSSPDIILSEAEDADLEPTFGEASPSTNQEIFDAGLHPNGKTRICIRVRNRGLTSAREFKARLYSAPLSTLVTPDRWQEANELEVSDGIVPQGDTLVVSNAAKWHLEKAASLVAVIEYEGSDEGPAPCHAANFNWHGYLRIMRRQRNVTVRNLHAVDLNEAFSCELDFKINGTPDAPRTFGFEIVRRLPEEVGIDLSAPIGLGLKFARGRLWRPSRNGHNTTLHLPKQARFALGTSPLPAAVDFPCKFKLKGAGSIRTGHSLAIRQLYRGEEVGRITWCFRRVAAG